MSDFKILQKLDLCYEPSPAWKEKATWPTAAKLAATLDYQPVIPFVTADGVIIIVTEGGLL